MVAKWKMTSFISFLKGASKETNCGVEKLKLKLKFTDFWNDWNKNEGNFFYTIFSKHYDIEFSDDPDILFYSNYGKEYLNYDCIRVFYSAENQRPDFTGCDFAISFDYVNKDSHLRFPLYGMYVVPEKLLTQRTREELVEIWEQKTKFCCMVVSNMYSKKRIDFYHRLSKYRDVDSGGKYLNNVGGPVRNKLEFIKDYKFVFAFENASYPGYTTEKIIEPLQVNSIPIYWGNPLIGREINEKRFINYDDFASEDELIRELIAIESDVERAIHILSQPVFPGGQVPYCVDWDNLLHFFDQIVSSRDKIVPVARTHKKIIHFFKSRSAVLQARINSKLFRNS